MSICQLQKKSISMLLLSFSLIYLVGCAETPVAPIKEAPKKMIQAQWFKLPLRFSSAEVDGSISIHPFFDSEWKPEDYEDWGGKTFRLPYFITTPTQSDFQYNFDMYSGKLYRQRKYCPQDDIWRTYTSTIEKPNFTQGIVPRIYNEKQNPQQIILFSSKINAPVFKKYPNSYSDAKVVGSVVIETCDSYPCDIKERWSTSQILIGVPYEDPEFSSIENFMELKNKIDWSYAKAMLTNMNGNHNLGGKYVPATRVLKELGRKDSEEYFKQKTQLVTPQNLAEITTWKEGCMKLYDSLWDESEKIRSEKNDQSQKFFTFFQDFYKKNSKELLYCQRLVRPANILDSTRRFWFFTYIQAFALLEQSGLSYNCRESSWNIHTKLEFGRCRAHNFEKSFEQTINGLRLMKTQLGQQYRFVEYDSLTGGSHQAVYAWIFEGPKSYACKSDKLAVDQINSEIFPQDVEWENFKQDDGRVVR